ncbi:MAG: iron ABC transporter permease [Gammaproteobacteria bacterium]|nr:iron ABC transporter permease [Gammaproteobacteria bacterium]
MSDRGLRYSLGITLLLLAIASLMVGESSLSISQLWSGVQTKENSVSWLILSEVRFPRTLIAIVTGATLGLAGAAMQGLLRNPLASPGLVGSANGAAFGAVVMLYFGVANLFPAALPIGGMVGALLATLIVYLLAGRIGGDVTLILAGLAINALALALISLLINLAPSPYAVQEIALWMLGSIANKSISDLWIMLPGTLLGWLLLAGVGRSLDALTLGAETAQTLGVDLVRLRWQVFAATALAVGSAVATCGAIGFVGLVIPHLLRPMVGYQPGRLLLVSALGGASLLLAADIAVRLLPSQNEINVGVLTSLVGAPFFLLLVLSNRRHKL